MIAYLGRRLTALLVILFGSSFILYNLAAISGDPTEGLRGSTDPKVKAQLLSLTRTLNLDVPPPARYFLWLKRIFSGFDFGKTRDGHPVSIDLAAAIPTTIRLILLATIIAIILGLAFGIVSALRQYSRFDYGMTFVAFLMYSLPIFWVAVLLKQYLAISFNDFLDQVTIQPGWIIALSLVSGIFWASLISGDRARVWKIFGIAGGASALLLTLLSVTKWFANPGIGPIVLLGLSVGAAYGITFLSTGLGNKPALRSAQSMAVIGLLLYYPNQYIFNHAGGVLTIVGLALLTALIGVGVSRYWAKIDRGPVTRTAIL
ncbi:MAG: hypothetical protein F2815_05390, partial [Actinobacteria bacterium]|nr:hypothetical protein [Actinomycetota bacterium]